MIDIVFKRKDFERLYIPIHKIDKQDDPRRHFPVLQKYNEFKGRFGDHIPPEMIIPYVIFVFDKNSPFVKTYTDIIQRRVYAALYSGYEYISSGSFGEKVEDFIRGRDAKVNRMIVRYCTLQSDEDWTALVSYQQAFVAETEKLININKRVAGEKKASQTALKTTIDNVEKLRGHIETLKKKILTTDEDRLLTETLYEFGQANELGITPEHYAKLRADSRGQQI